MRMRTEDKKLRKLLDEYNNCFLEKNIEKLRSFYPENNSELIYFDNHKKNDTYTVDAHLKLLDAFFQNGKETESGTVEEIIMDNMHYYKTETSACICFHARYKSFPKPAVRSTMYLEKDNRNWKIKHVHCSFEPDK